MILLASAGIIVVNQYAWLYTISLSLVLSVYACVVNMHACGCTFTCFCRGERRIANVLLYHTLLESLKTGTLIEPKSH